MRQNYGNSPYAANLLKFNIYRVLINFALWLPIWVVYLIEKRGLNFTQVTLLDAPFWLVAALSEVPTGAVADIYGRKTSLAIGGLLFAAAVFVFGIADSFALILFSYLLWALSGSFMSGASDAFFYDSLRAMGREGEFTRIGGRSQALAQASWAAASLLGAPLAAIDLSLPILLSAAIYLFAFLVILTFREPPRFQDHPASGYWATIGSSLRLAAARPAVRYPSLYGILLGLFGMMTVVIFFQPYARELGVPVAWLGFAFVILVRLPGMLGAEASHWLVAWVGERRLINVIPWAVIPVTLLLAVNNTALGLAFLPVLALLFWIPRPLLDTMVNRELPSALRATVISVQALVFALFAMVVEPLLGYLVDQKSLSFSIITLAVGVGSVLLAILFLWNRALPWREPMPAVVPAVDAAASRSRDPSSQRSRDD